MKCNWVLKHFSELTTKELYNLLQIRSEVFVVEQNCVYQDIDSKDVNGYHLLGVDFNSDTIVAYARLLPAGISYDLPSIGRVLTAPKHRSIGLGKELMTQCLQSLQTVFPNQGCKISAQLYLLKFYNSFGFVEIGLPYDEDGIPHIEMFLSQY